jgi:hypothetical protein
MVRQQQGMRRGSEALAGGGGGGVSSSVREMTRDPLTAWAASLAPNSRYRVSLKRLLDESPWLQFASECQRF